MQKQLVAKFLSMAFIATSLSANAANVKIGVINSVTGPEAPIGESISNGIKLAQEDLAAKGTKIDLVWEDDTGKPQIAMSAMEKLATRDKVAGVVGPYTSASSSAVARIAEKYKVSLLVPAAAKEEITRQNFKWVYRMNAPADVYASVLLDAVNEMSKGGEAPKTVALIYENSDFGTSTTKTAKDYLAKKGMKVVADESYAKGSPDYRSTLSKIKAQKPDIVFMVSYVADAILLMRQSREIGLQPKAFLGAGAGFTTDQFAKEKDISSHVLSSTQWTEDVKWPGAQDFAKRYKEKFKMEATYHAACAYASMIVMGETAVKAAGDREKVRADLKAGQWSGIMGNVKFDDYNGYQNQNRHTMLVQQIVNGKYLTVYPADLAVAKPVYPFPQWK